VAFGGGSSGEVERVLLLGSTAAMIEYFSQTIN